MKASRIVTALAASLAFATPALAVDWNFYHHQSAPLFATSRGAKMLSEEIEKVDQRRAEGAPASLGHAADRAEQHHAGGRRAASCSSPTTCSTPATSRSPASRACPGLVRSYEEFAKTAEVLRPYLEKAFADKGIVMLGGLHLSAAGDVGKEEAHARSTTSRA